MHSSLAAAVRLWCRRRLCSQAGAAKDSPLSGPGLDYFLRRAAGGQNQLHLDKEADSVDWTGNKSVYIETRGCQMNVADTEIVASILSKSGYAMVSSEKQADVYLIMTCAIREGAENKVRNRLQWLANQSRPAGRQPIIVGVLGCMAERLKSKLFDECPIVRVICGPDAYRDLPRLLADAGTGQRGANTQLSLEETYADVNPIRMQAGAATAFVSIMRGCDNHCAFCVVPQTRGRERSTPVESVADQVARLVDAGVRDITLLGQNVNSYRDVSVASGSGWSSGSSSRTAGFSANYAERAGGLRFADLLDRLSRSHPGCRFRFTSPHPKDFPVSLLQLIGERPNLANRLHLPAQSGSTSVLDRMRRHYSREAYIRLVDEARSVIPQLAITTDIISGFCGETEAEHLDTLDLLRRVRYTFVYYFKYSERQRTRAQRLLADDVPEEVKRRRSAEIRHLFQEIALADNRRTIGQRHLVLIEGDSQHSASDWHGRNDQGIRVVLPKRPADGLSVGRFVAVQITGCAGVQTLLAEPLVEVPDGPAGFAVALAELDRPGCGDA